MSLAETCLSEDEEFLSEPLAIAGEILAAQDGDREAFGALVQRFEPMVYGYALRRTGQHAEAEELTQEVFIQALRKLHQLRDPACFGGWLRSITARLAINRAVRRRATTPLEPAALDAAAANWETPEDHALLHERRNQVRDVLAGLGTLDRQTLVAFYLEGQSLLEMADAFDAPLGTIKRRLHVARKRFAAALGEEIPEFEFD